MTGETNSRDSRSKIENLARKLRRLGPYQIKHTKEVGWWIDGRCGYQVSGYFPEKIIALSKGIERICEAKRDSTQPVWLF